MYVIRILWVCFQEISAGIIISHLFFLLKISEKYNSLEKGFNLVPGGGFLPNRQKIKDEDIITALCYLEKFGDGYGKTIEEFFNWSKGTFSSLKTKNSYLAAKEKFAVLTKEEKENRIEITKDKIE